MEFKKICGGYLENKGLRINENNFRLLGKVMYHFSVVESTNKVAISLAERDGKEGTLILADEQISGEGRMGRKWFSPPGGLWFSLILHPTCPLNLLSFYPVMGAIAIKQTIEKIYPSCPVQISWPNDVMVKNKKIAGVMCKIKIKGGKLKFSILGIGVNLNIEHFPFSLQDNATSLFLETRQLISPSYFLDILLDNLEILYFLSKTDLSLFLDKIKQFLPFIKNKVQIAT